MTQGNSKGFFKDGSRSFFKEGSKDFFRGFFENGSKGFFEVFWLFCEFGDNFEGFQKNFECFDGFECFFMIFDDFFHFGCFCDCYDSSVGFSSNFVCFDIFDENCHTFPHNFLHSFVNSIDFHRNNVIFFDYFGNFNKNIENFVNNIDSLNFQKMNVKNYFSIDIFPLDVRR